MTLKKKGNNQNEPLTSFHTTEKREKLPGMKIERAENGRYAANYTSFWGGGKA